MIEKVCSSAQNNKVARVAAFFDGVICYAIFSVTFLCICGFVGNFGVPRAIDSVPMMPWDKALLIAVAVLGIFGVHHSVMARKHFKAWWTQFVPTPVERSTYILFSSLCLIGLVVFTGPGLYSAQVAHRHQRQS
jgi:protein-S-isoprenylcysteine O-methyltransferase Ste14